MNPWLLKMLAATEQYFGVFALDSRRLIVLFNHTASAITGFSKTEALGKPYTSVLQFVSSHGQKIEAHFIHSILNGKRRHQTGQIHLQTKTGKIIPVAVNSSPLVNLEGKIEGVIVVFRDITEEIEFDRVKDEFISTTAHQLRTPLGTMRWYLEMLLSGDKGKLSKAIKTVVDRMSERNLQLISIVNDLLDISRINQGKVSDKPQLQDIGSLIKESISKFIDEANKRNIQIKNNFKTKKNISFSRRGTL